MSWWQGVQVSWYLCRDWTRTSDRGQCWVSTEAWTETIGTMPGEDGATIHYPLLSSTILAPPVRTTHNSSPKQYNYESYLFQSIVFHFEVWRIINGNLVLWPGKLDSNEVMFGSDTGRGSTAPELVTGYIWIIRGGKNKWMFCWLILWLLRPVTLILWMFISTNGIKLALKSKLNLAS